MKKRSLCLLAVFFTCSFYLIEVHAQEMFYFKNREAENSINDFKQSTTLNFKKYNSSAKPKHYFGFSPNVFFSNLHFSIPDFQVNENAGPNDAIQQSSQIASDDSGNFIIVWEDNRNGNFDIYAQVFSNQGTQIGSNFKVNNDETSLDQKKPAIAFNENGNFVIVWLDGQNSQFDIYAQQYHKTGKPIGENIKANECNGSVSGEFFSYPVVDYDRDGNFVVIWLDVRNNMDKKIDYYGQIYKSDGVPSGLNFRINDVQGGVYRYSSASVAIGLNQKFVVTWCDVDRGISAQLFTIDGNRIGNNFKVAFKTKGATAKIKMNADGDFLIIWMAPLGGSSSHYIASQLFSKNGIPLDSIKIVNQKAIDFYFNNHIVTESNGNFLIIWLVEHLGKATKFAQRVLNNGEFEGDNFKFISKDENLLTYSSEYTTDGCNYFYTTFINNKHNDEQFDSDVYAQCFFKDSLKQTIMAKVNDDIASSPQTNSKIIVGPSGNYVISWIDCRNSYSLTDVYAKIYRKDGTVLRNDFNICQENLQIAKESHAIASDSVGNFIITWSETDHTNYKYERGVFFQRFTNDGVPLGNKIKVDDNYGQYFRKTPAIAMDKNGDFVIVWEDYRNIADLYAQYFLMDGTPVGNNRRMYNSGFNPAIATDTNNNYYVAFEMDDKICVRLVSWQTNHLSFNFKNTINGHSPSIAADKSGDIILTWRENSSNSYNMLTQRFSSSGDPIGDIIQVASIDGSVWRDAHPTISIDNVGNTIILWENGNDEDIDIYGQRFSVDGKSFGANFCLTDNMRFQNFPDVKLFDNKIYSTWTDNRVDGKGFDIWANVMLFNQPPMWISSNMATAFEDSSFEYHANAMDPEGFAIGYTFQDYPDWCTVADSIIYGTPPEGTEDTSFVVIASDGQISDTLKVAITVIPINDPPQIINLSDFQLKNNEPYIINLDTCVNDVDNLPEDMVWKVNPVDNRLRADIVNRVAIFSAPNWTGEADVLFKVTDPEGASDSISIKVNVINPSLVREREQRIPEKFSLEQNYPNPFNPQTNITFGLPKPSEVTIDIFNLTGELVTTIFKGRKAAGYHTIVWDASKFPSGTYFVKLQADDFVQIRKCVLLN